MRNYPTRCKRFQRRMQADLLPLWLTKRDLLILALLSECGILDTSQMLAKDALIAIYDSGWEDNIQFLQTLPPRACIVHNKYSSGVVLITTLNMPSAHELAGKDEEKFRKDLATLPISEKYLRLRQETKREEQDRQKEFSTAGEDPKSNREKR